MTGSNRLITGVDFVCTPAQDFEAMSAFYGETLGDQLLDLTGTASS